MSQFAVLIYAPDSAHAIEATPEELATCDRHAEQLAGSGVMTAAWALQPREFARSVRRAGVTEGPYLGATECVAGFYLIEAPDLETAVAIAATNPAVLEGGGVEVRPVHSGGFVEASEPP